MCFFFASGSSPFHHSKNSPCVTSLSPTNTSFERLTGFLPLRDPCDPKPLEPMT